MAGFVFVVFDIATSPHDERSNQKTCSDEDTCPVRTAARMIVEVGTSFNSIEASVVVIMFTSAFECIVCDGESNSVVGGRVAAAGLMVLAGLGMAAPCGVVPVSEVLCSVVPVSWCNTCSCDTLLWRSC